LNIAWHRAALAGLALVLFLLFCSLAPATQEPSNPDGSAGRVYLIRGQGWAFSGGWRVLRDRLRRAGVRADDISDLSADWVVRDILEDHRAGQLAGPIVLVGHSRGGRQALFAAERLAREGVNIDLILTVDVAIPPPVPAGVSRAVNLYLARQRFYPARPLKPARDSGTIIENIALDMADSPVDARGRNHLTITDSPEVQDYLFRSILKVIRGRDG
jgi:thioesterase domain-containing protein